MLKEKVTMKSV